MKTAARNRESGISLVEMMVALSVGLLLTVSVSTILSGSLQIFRMQGESARIQESSRFLMDILGRQITQAGYVAISTDYTDSKLSFVGTPISGEHGVVATRTGERKNGSDYLAVSFDANVDCQGNVATSGTVRNEFFLNANEELVCAGGGVTPEVLADGVETFQVLYGVDADGDYSVERYAAQPDDWEQVRTVRVCVVVRAFSQGTGSTAQQYQDCSGVSQTAPDTRLRRVLATTFQLRNRGI
ncbi:MAG: PilW family protein [Pseudomonadota bacterium]|nr:PilW family protein [Pseudomonadota bacterium]